MPASTISTYQGASPVSSERDTYEAEWRLGYERPRSPVNRYDPSDQRQDLASRASMYDMDHRPDAYRDHEITGGVYMRDRELVGSFTARGSMMRTDATSSSNSGVYAPREQRAGRGWTIDGNERLSSAMPPPLYGNAPHGQTRELGHGYPTAWPTQQSVHSMAESPLYSSQPSVQLNTAEHYPATRPARTIESNSRDGQYEHSQQEDSPNLHSVDAWEQNYNNLRPGKDQYGRYHESKFEEA